MLTHHQVLARTIGRLLSAVGSIAVIAEHYEGGGVLLGMGLGLLWFVVAPRPGHGGKGAKKVSYNERVATGWTVRSVQQTLVRLAR